MTTAGESASTLKSLIRSGRRFIAADCYSALTARIVEQVGFEAAYMGGHATGMMHYAIPDCGVLTTTEMIEQAARVAEAISIPLIVDADQAGESVADVYRTVRRYERVGVAGIHIEDELTPKHSIYDGPLLAVDDMQARIAAAVEARHDPDFVLIARSDELYSQGGAAAVPWTKPSGEASPMPRRESTFSCRRLLRKNKSPGSQPRSRSRLPVTANSSMASVSVFPLGGVHPQQLKATIGGQRISSSTGSSRRTRSGFPRRTS